MSVLWSELGIIHRQAKNAECFDYGKTSYRLKAAPEVHFAEAIAWSSEKSEAFAGIHADNVLYIFDEASAIDDIIWEVSQGAMTNPRARWLVLGNPTRNQGKFHECFGKNAWREGETDTSLWHTFTVSCLDSPRVSNEYVAEVEREYGKDSDPYRVRVLGLPPLQESQQFISVDLFETALHKSVASLEHEPNILWCDPARFGDDATAIGERKGRNAKLLCRLHGQDTMAIVGKLIHYINTTEEDYDYVVIDEIGIGAGIVDRMREQQFEVSGVNVAEKSRRDDCKNLRAELWYLMKEWLKEGHLTEEFRESLLAPQYSFDSNGKLILERKEDIKKRGLKSPDEGDGLALSFYPRNPIKVERMLHPQRRPVPSWGKKVGLH